MVRADEHFPLPWKYPWFDEVRVGTEGDIEHPEGIAPTVSASAGAAAPKDPATSPAAISTFLIRLLIFVHSLGGVGGRPNAV